LSQVLVRYEGDDRSKCVTLSPHLLVEVV